MTPYSDQRRDRIFVKKVLSFAKNISKNLSSKYRQKLLDHAKQSAGDTLKTTSKRAIKKPAGITGDLIGNTIANQITKKSLQNTSVTVKSETEKPRERCKSPQGRQQIIDKFR